MIERLIIDTHGISKIEAILEKIKGFDDCTFIAINQKEVSAIVYQTDKRPITSDRLNGEGFLSTRYKDISSLKSDLDDLSYWLVHLPLLLKEIELHKLREQLALKVLPKEGEKIKELRKLMKQLNAVLED